VTELRRDTVKVLLLRDLRSTFERLDLTNRDAVNATIFRSEISISANATIATIQYDQYIEGISDIAFRTFAADDGITISISPGRHRPSSAIACALAGC
jgi:hypothetical protein